MARFPDFDGVAIRMTAFVSGKGNIETWPFLPDNFQGLFKLFFFRSVRNERLAELVKMGICVVPCGTIPILLFDLSTD